jgi:hypothetical protein
MYAKDGSNSLLKAAAEISIDGPAGTTLREDQVQETEAQQARPAAPQTPAEIPDAPEMVKAGENQAVREEVDENDPQRGGLSGPGSYEAAMRMFGPKTIEIPASAFVEQNPHGVHEVTEEG